MSKPVKKPRIGAHTPTTGGMAKRSIAYAQEIGAEAIQVFASSPRTWAMPESKPELDDAFKIKAAELDIETYVHAPFLINLGSPTEATYLNSLASTQYSLKRGAEIGALGVVIHTGSAVDVNHVEKAWKQIHEGMMPILNALGDDAPYLLLEPTAGQGQSLVKKLDDLEMYLKALEYHPKVGICLDTCHAHAAGYDFSTVEGFKGWEKEAKKQNVLGAIRALHLNDSKKGCGSRVDRHEHIGLGTIGREGIQRVLKHKTLKSLPMYLETEKGTNDDEEEWDAINMRVLRELE